ncbi:uncharacterized protein [Coffea arabica]|uniref:Uncharacterized protein LOC113692378 n=1 Tax=Coffea arabica TaxID=13443 RepID=A0A6P6SL18_COFAR|nr:uncharacterized protein LOC113692378 [Coffea arabica]
MEGGGSNSNPSSAAWSAPQLPTDQKIRRMKLYWRAALISNFVLGAYLFIMPKKKQINAESSKAVEAVPPPPVETTSPVHEEPPFIPSPEVPVKVQKPVPEDQQRELFKWILEEKRKVKPQNRKEKQRIDEEKAILKQFIQKESIPGI